MRNIKTDIITISQILKKQEKMKQYSILIIIALLIVIVAWFLYQISPPSYVVSEIVPITILSGSPGRDDMITGVSHNLYWSGLVKNENLTAFLIYLFTFGEDRPLEPDAHYTKRK